MDGHVHASAYRARAKQQNENEQLRYMQTSEHETYEENEENGVNARNGSTSEHERRQG